MKTLKEKLKKDFGISFKDDELLETAFTHTSYANEHRLLNISHNERLEFLGDAVLQLIISDYLYRKYPKKPEGELSKQRSTIVREESLAGFSRDCGFDAFVRLGKGEEKTGGRHREKILEDLFEAFLGALLLDKGVEEVKAFLYRVIIPKIEKGEYEQVKDYKTALQERLQVDGDIIIKYEVTAEKGPAHDKIFEIQVKVNDEVISNGQGRSKKSAEQEAAKKALDQIGEV